MGDLMRPKSAKCGRTSKQAATCPLCSLQITVIRVVNVTFAMVIYSQYGPVGRIPVAHDFDSSRLLMTCNDMHIFCNYQGGRATMVMLPIILLRKPSDLCFASDICGLWLWPLITACHRSPHNNHHHVVIIISNHHHHQHNMTVTCNLMIIIIINKPYVPICMVDYDPLYLVSH